MEACALLGRAAFLNGFSVGAFAGTARGLYLTVIYDRCGQDSAAMSARRYLRQVARFGQGF